MANTTPGAASVGWVSEPTSRGTASLLLSCVSTIIVSTWSALHLNVPSEEASGASIFRQKLKYLALALIAPEVVAVTAFNDCFNARSLTKSMRKIKNQDEWPSALSFFVVMGGVAIHDQDGETMRLPPDVAVDFLQNGWILGQQLSPGMVADKSKADWFTKAIASLQITWFFSQLIGRATSHLSITVLELFTLAYVVCALWAHAFWWDKPYDVRVPLSIPAQPSFTSQHKSHIISKTQAKEDFIKGHMANFSAPMTQSSTKVPFFILLCSLFGACHILAWNARFPTSIERLLWRIGSVSCVVLPLFIMSYVFLYDLVSNKFHWFKFNRAFLAPCVLILSALYVVIRLFLLFEAFFALRSVAPDVYVTVPWSQYIPHI